MSATAATLRYAAPTAERTPLSVDLRVPGPGAPPCVTNCTISDARQTPGLGLDSSGFTLLEQPAEVSNWMDADEVMRTYYAHCRALAARLTGASHTFTFDHLLRQDGRQIAGGGLGPSGGQTGPQGGGGFIHSVHMDYTTSSQWTEYLALHGCREPRGAARVVVLNFWRPLVDVVEDNPLAVCDARTVAPEDLREVMIYGYGPPGYSWHNIGISTYSVAPAARHRWYYYPRMTRNEVLVIRSFDSAGVIGRTCPHTAFSLPRTSGAVARRSIELRVLCYIGAQDG